MGSTFLFFFYFVRNTVPFVLDDLNTIAARFLQPFQHLVSFEKKKHLLLFNSIAKTRPFTMLMSIFVCYLRHLNESRFTIRIKLANIQLYWIKTGCWFRKMNPNSYTPVDLKSKQTTGGIGIGNQKRLPMVMMVNSIWILLWASQNSNWFFYSTAW